MHKHYISSKIYVPLFTCVPVSFNLLVIEKGFEWNKGGLHFK